MDPSSLAVAVHVAPMRPFVGPSGATGDQPMWSPISSTLVAGARDAILVDTPITIDQVDVLADWVRGFDRRIVGVYITHGHSDHWIGLARLQEHFPEARGWATPEVVARARFEATDPDVTAYWQACFPGELADPLVLPEELSTTTLELEGQPLEVISVGQGDTEYSTVLHVPGAAAVICGDVVYNRVHMMTAETDAAGRAAWIDSLDRVAALAPRTVVAGHKRVGAPDLPDSIAASQEYLRDFTSAVQSGADVEQIVAVMLARHGDRDNPRTLWHSARVAVSAR